MLKKILFSLLLTSTTLFTGIAAADTVPQPLCVNGQWQAPAGWQFWGIGGPCTASDKFTQVVITYSVKPSGANMLAMLSGSSNPNSEVDIYSSSYQPPSTLPTASWHSAGGKDAVCTAATNNGWIPVPLANCPIVP